MEEVKKTEKRGCSCSIVIIVCIVLVVGLDIVAGFVGLQAAAAQQDVNMSFIYHSQQMIMMMVVLILFLV